jgi:hypothetical protein
MIEQQLEREFPNLYSEGIYLECGPGWYDIIYRLSAELELLIREEHARDPDGEPIHAVQVKSKWGGLRFYLNWETREMSKAIAKAEQLCLAVCDVCGNIRRNSPMEYCNDHN